MSLCMSAKTFGILVGILLISSAQGHLVVLALLYCASQILRCFFVLFCFVFYKLKFPDLGEEAAAETARELESEVEPEDQIAASHDTS